MKTATLPPKRSLRIAVADDERDMREYLQEGLARLGHEVVAAASTGQELAEQCTSAAPDLIITDVRMPGLDGIQAGETVNRLKATPIILTARLSRRPRASS
jgi:CheY-like chemotaxis protein